jgi:hypothetical protein
VDITLDDADTTAAGRSNMMEINIMRLSKFAGARRDDVTSRGVGA